MTPKRRPINPELQGSLFADTPELGPAPVAVGEGFYMPLLSLELQESVQQKEAEQIALDYMDVEVQSRNYLNHNAGRLKTALKGKTEQSDEQKAAISDLQAKMSTSTQSLHGILLAQKGNFARSRGIAFQTADVVKTDDSGRELLDAYRQPLFEKKIVALDELQQTDLDVGFVSFRSHYAGPQHDQVRKSQKKVLNAEMYAILAKAADQQAASLRGDVGPDTLNQPLQDAVGQHGTYSVLSVRNLQLLKAIGHINQRVSRLTFDTASNVPEHNGPITARYGKNLPNVQKGAARNAEAHLKAAEREFKRATGYTALQAIGYAPEQELDARFRQAWRLFLEAYGGIKSKQARQTFVGHVDSRAHGKINGDNPEAA